MYRSSRSLALALGLVVLPLLPSLAAAAEPAGRLGISGDYRYRFHDPETPEEAKQLACREALRLAVTSSPLFREETASLVDHALVSELATLLATQHVADYQVIQQTERGRTVSCRITGVLPIEDSVRAIHARVVGDVPTTDVDRNRALRILSVQETPDGYVAVQYQALKRLDWLTTGYDGTLRDAADVLVDFFDEHGLLIKSVRHPARRTRTQEDVMQSGAIGSVKLPKPLRAKSYRVWLVK